MHVISFSSRKGGSGKSTIAAHLSVFADRTDAPALLIDTDPQGSLAFWHELRAAPTPLLVKCDHNDLAAVIEDAKREGLEFAR